MNLVRLIYASQLSEKCRPDNVRSLLQTARERNPKAGVTGILCYNPLYFTQWIEGGRHAVNRIFESIMRDPRHENVVILDYAEVPEREFTDWSMAYVDTDHLDRRLILKFCPTDTFNPMTMSAESARRFLIEIAERQKDSLDGTLTD